MELNSFWNWFSIALIVLSILGCWWLLHWTKGVSDREDDDDVHDTGHVWDENIRELNNPLPRWWLNLFNITIIFALVYLALYPGLGNLAGVLGWTQEEQHAEELAKAEAETAGVFASYNAMPLEELIRNPAAMETGRRLWGQNCAMCHGSDLQGATGFPNLVDEHWQWGQGYDNVLMAINGGRNAAMPPWAPALGEEGVDQVIEYTRSLSGLEHDDALAAEGEGKYGMFCVACHGPEGKGNPALGAPNLTDGYWLYGSDRESIEYGLRNGRYGVMPAFEGQLSEDRRKLLAAYVLGMGEAAAIRQGRK
mgnify:CR=1 FL=1